MIIRILRDNGEWLLLWLLLLAASLYARPPIPVDETRYLSVAWEMWRSGDFLVPHINGEPYSHKPPLLFWLIHLGWWLFGVNEWSARMTPPLFGLGAIFLARGLAARLWPGERTTRQAVPFLLLGCFFWGLYSTLTLFDMLVAFFSLLALHGLLLAHEGRAGVGWGMFALALGLGILAKGPVILVYVAGPALLAPLWRIGKEGSWPAWYGGLLAALVVAAGMALAWALPAARAGGQQYGQAILFGQTAGRMVRAFAHQRAFWWYLVSVPLLLLPWPLCGIFWRGRIGRPGIWSWPVRFCLTVLVPAFLILSLVSGKQVHYLLPLLPIAALVAAHGISREGGKSGSSLFPLVFFYLLLAVLLFLLPRLPFTGGDADLLVLVPPLLGLVPLLAAMFLWDMGRLGTGSVDRVRLTGTVAVLVLICLQIGMRSPLQRLYGAEAVFADMHAVQARGLDIAVYPERFADQFHFAGRLSRPLIRQPILPRELVWAYHNPESYCLIFVEEEKDMWLLEGEGVKRRYGKGWLLFRPARGLYDEYLAMERKAKERRDGS